MMNWIWKEAFLAESRYYSGIFLEVEGKNQDKPHSGGLGVSAEIRTQHLSRASLGHYRYTNLLSYLL
jgi:hypothetical protein